MISFVVCGVSMLSRASSAPDSPGSASATLSTEYCGSVSPSGPSPDWAAARKAWLAWRSR